MAFGEHRYACKRNRIQRIETQEAMLVHGTNDPRRSSLWIALVVILFLPVALVDIGDAQDIVTVVGGYFVDGVPGGELSILPQAMTLSPQGDLYFLDARNERIWKVDQLAFNLYGANFAI